MNKTKLYIILYCLLLNSICFSQKTTISIDTTLNIDTSYYSQYDHVSFFNTKKSDQILDLTNPDYNLLNATVFFTLNRIRVSKRRVPYKFSSSLYRVAFYYNSMYNSTKLENVEKNQKRIRKKFNPLCKAYGFNGALTEFSIASITSINERNFRKLYYDKKDSTTPLKLFMGEKPKASDTVTIKTPVKLYTYQEFAEVLLKSWKINKDSYNKKSRAYTVGGCCITIDNRTLYKRKFPKAKAIFVFGGYRIKRDPEI